NYQGALVATAAATAPTKRLHRNGTRTDTADHSSADVNLTTQAVKATTAAVAVEGTIIFKEERKTSSVGVDRRTISISVEPRDCFIGAATVKAASPAAILRTQTTTSHYVNSVNLHENRENHQSTERNQFQRYNRETFSFTLTLVTALLLYWWCASNNFVVAGALPEVSTASGNEVHGDGGVDNGLAFPTVAVNASRSPCTLNIQRNVSCHSALPHSDVYDTNGNVYNIQQPITETTVSLQFIQPSEVFDTATTIKSVAAANESVESVTITPLLIVSAASFTDNASTEPDIDQVPQIPAYICTTAMCFCIAIMTLGVIGNIMVPIVIVKTKDMRNSTNIFLTNLSIADLLVLLVCTPTVLVEVNTRPETWVLGHAMCKAVPFIELTVAHASVLTILAISFERYYAICEPLKAGYVCTKARAILICILAWGLAAIFTSPIIWVADYKFVEYIDGSSVAVCLTQAVNNWTIGYFLMTVIVFFILPLLILIVLYAIIAKNLISSNGPMLRIRPSKPELSLKARKQVVLMLGAVVLSFFLCLLPFRMLTMWIILSSEQTFFDIGIERYYSLLYFCRIMFYLNSAINPILYNLMSTKFRKGFLRLILNTWNAAALSLTCGRYRRIRARTGTITGVATNTNTNTSNTATSNTTSSSILSRQSNRRYSDDTAHIKTNTRSLTKTQIQIQMHIPCGPESEMLAMLHSSAIATASTATTEDEVLQKREIIESGKRKYSVRKCKRQSTMRELTAFQEGQQPKAKSGRHSVHVSFDDEGNLEEAVTLT
ncbi:G-protein coupled receptor 39-like, partial [Anastrepha ludens]|uniref:G-protein coupled receptor 39-like n=1 Tax=Anastrepha ludens TaxID=28586 RepID=UPI0023B09965